MFHKKWLINFATYILFYFHIDIRCNRFIFLSLARWTKFDKFKFTEYPMHEWIRVNLDRILTKQYYKKIIIFSSSSCCSEDADYHSTSGLIIWQPHSPNCLNYQNKIYFCPLISDVFCSEPAVIVNYHSLVLFDFYFSPHCWG